jgi:hypothetical protein
VAKIELSNAPGEFTVVDDIYYDFLKLFTWTKHTSGYAYGNVYGKNVYLHRYIARTPKGLFTDHINRDKLDNRKENLRNCTPLENQRNSVKPAGKCGYRGVTIDKRKKTRPYVARIKIDKYHKHLGMFATAKEAALAYNEAALKYHGEFAILNEVLL